MLHLSRARLHERVQSGEMIESIDKKPQTHKILAPTAFEDSLKKLKTTLGKLLRLKIEIIFGFLDFFLHITLFAL